MQPSILPQSWNQEKYFTAATNIFVKLIIYQIFRLLHFMLLIFDDIDDIAWFSSSLIRNVIDAHAPVKSKIITKQSAPYMNSKLRKAQYARNMVRNKFQRFGKAYWEENRRHRNNVVKIGKSSMRIYFEKKNVKNMTNNSGERFILSCLTRSLEMGVI